MTQVAPERLTIDPDVLDRVNAALDDIREGKMVILVDDEDRENEGDLTIAAEKCTPEAINFMAKFGRGLICLALDEQQVARLDLPMMRAPGRAGPPLGTAFTVSIEAARGVTTGISAADRAHTVQVAISPDVKPRDVVTPGHVFPLKARPGGVLVRTGQTEGAVDLARLAGLRSSGVICEIMKDDGTMARMPDLEVFAKEHELRILTVADLIEYRLQTERLVQKLDDKVITLAQTGTAWRGIVYDALVEDRQAFALVKGDVAVDEPVLCRVHSGSTLTDVFGGSDSRGQQSLRRAIAQIEREGRGVLLYLASKRSLAEELGRMADAIPRPADSMASVSVVGAPVEEPATGPDQSILRRLGLGAQILADVGVRRLRLLTNSERRVVGLKGYGLEIVERVPLVAENEETP
jgi:3,4-dihydroxy 2-butanone 4-phosphate synthase / GTP cyclohydrolase II